jgi:hypothetical protein
VSPDAVRPSSTTISRRAVLAGGASLALLAACGKSGDGSANDSVLSLEPGGDQRVLIANFAYGGGYLISGAPQRLIYLVGLGGAPTTDAPPELTFQLSLDGDDVGDPITVAAQTDGVPVPYFPVRATFDRPGLWKATTEIDGTEDSSTFQVSEPADVPLVQPGQSMRPLDTPTVDDHRGVEPICTDAPECPLHAQTLTAALATGQPTALLVATPAYCQTSLCGPVLTLLLEEVANHPQMQFVHAEVYTDAAAVGDVSQATTAPIIDTYGLTFEPSLFVADATGTVQTRLDNVYDRVELREALAGVS